MHITLRANEKIFINGAVLKVDRKTSIELMNDAVFLLEAHVMLERDATTPLRQLYYIVQLMLMEARERPENRTMFAGHCAAMAKVYDEAAIIAGVAKVSALVGRSRHFEALKVIRGLLPVEAAMTGRPQEAGVRIKPTPVPGPALAEAC
ncbi:flagellar biosynthesis repressor FlbT [Lichenibacterium ramalinae]|uniref:Flagellar biosynthesis repressor FlbT n=1 Tax=Lichenibacterium ramalinae TaxID=2316527 RepID=A0A4Q2RDR2_9HYPH|nr:flagellar biosynthesis repressor FlbT [Lichenibacterium ramalinae]RYB05964.1 flagellar biosynthesis repressor FlbT [Lichenibacterium ramalinae]